MLGKGEKQEVVYRGVKCSQFSLKQWIAILKKLVFQRKSLNLECVLVKTIMYALAS